MAQWVKKPPANATDMVRSLNQKDPLSAGVRKLASGEEAVFGNELLFLPRR